MKRHTLMVLGMALFGLPVLAAAASNFGGSWVRETAKSDPVPSMLILNRPPATQGRGGPGRGNAEFVLTVKQDGNNLEVTPPDGGTLKYTLDGKPFTRNTEEGITKATVTASLQGDTLTIVTSQPYGGMPGNNTLQVKEVWSVSPDGKTLTITTTRTIPAVEKTFKQVYSRK